MGKKVSSESGKIWLKKETRSYRGWIFFLAVLVAFSTLFSLLFAYMVRFIINSATDGNADKLWIFALILLCLLFLRIILKTLSGFFSEKLRARITSNLRIKFFSKILRSNYADVQKYHSGDMLNRLTSDIREIAVDTVGLVPSAVGMIVQCAGVIAALMTIDPIFTIVYVVCGGIFGSIITLFRRQVKKMHKEVLEADGKFRSFMQEGLSSIMTLKAYNAEWKTTKKAEVYAEDFYQKRMKRNTLHSFMNAVFSTLSNFGLILAVVWCGISVLNGNTDYGSILSVILLLMQLQQPFSTFSSLIPAYYARIASGERLAEIDDLALDTEEKLAKNEQISYQKLHSIDLKNITFTYGRENIFEEVSYSLEKGKIICLTGASGAGKSTIFKLLLNVFKPLNGGIYFNEKCDKGNERHLTQQHRNLFAYVPQGHFLFSGTIYENITFFSDETNKKILRDKIKEVLKIACAEFVWNFPNGLDTVLTEGGGGLSEGQLQRLAIARALLSERPILLLDEATSALDNDTEQKLLQNIRGLKDKTCLIVTHRPAALEIADEIIYIENGKVTQVKK